MGRAMGARRWRARQARPRSRLALGIAILGALACADGIAARPAAPAHVSWAGPAPDGAWAATGLTLQTNALIADPRHPGVLLAGTEDGIWRSGDGGLHWARAGGGLRGRAIDALAASAADDTVFAGTADGAVYAHGTRLDGPWRRLGAPLGANPVFSLAVSSGRRGTVLAGTIGALYRGSGDGHTWTWRRVARTGEAAISSIAWSPSDARGAMASVFGATPPVLATRDGGWTWRAAATGLPPELPTQALLALPAPRPRLVLTTMGGGVWERAADGEGPWRDISAGLPERHAMPAVALPGGAMPVVYAGTMGDGVYVKQGDAAWRALGHGLTGVDNTILALALSGGTRGVPTALLAGTAYGVFRYVAPAMHARSSTSPSP